VYPEIVFFFGGVRVALATHAGAITLGFAAGLVLALRRDGGRPEIVLAASAVTVAALVASHGLFRLLHGGGGGLWSGGLASTAGLAAGLGTTGLAARFARRPFAELLDAIAPAGILGLAIGRVGCFLGGCCYGRPTTLPWGVVFPELGPPARHPLQLYSAAGDMLLLCLLPARGRVPGNVARRACLGLGILRFALEFLRDPAATDPLPGGRVTLAQAAAVALVAWATFGLHRPGPFEYGSAAEEGAWPMRRP
jgi:phosphatidylglycerol:prolipoprotein diacylglycerol transferase